MPNKISRLTGILVFCTVIIASAAPITWNGHEYEVFVTGSISWQNSRAQAQSIGAGWDLATITSIEEQNFIASLVGPAPSPSILTEYYIGGQRTDGVNWTWVTGENFNFSYWGAGEPNYSYENVIALDNRFRIPNWGWNNYTGDAASFVKGFVAEKHAVPEPAAISLLGLAIFGLLVFKRKK